MPRSDPINVLEVSHRAFKLGMYFSSRVKFGQCDFLLCTFDSRLLGTFDTRYVREFYVIVYQCALESMEAIKRAVA